MKLVDMQVNDVVTRPNWAGLTVQKTEPYKWAYIKGGRINTVLTSKNTAFNHDDFYKVDEPKKEKQ